MEKQQQQEKDTVSSDLEKSSHSNKSSDLGASSTHSHRSTDLPPRVARRGGNKRPSFVNSRNSVSEWRARDVLSEGASERLYHKLETRRMSSRRSLMSPEDFDSDEDGNVSGSDDGKPMDRSFISSLIEDLIWAFAQWEGAQRISTAMAEDWAIFLHGGLTRESRGYHGIRHVFEICAGASPVQFLAAVFRDIISYYIDSETSLSSREKQLLEGVLEPNTFRLQSKLDDPRDLMVVEIFGFELGSDLAAHQGLHKGLDVFLSTILASRFLKDALPMANMACLAAVLEATIPFRKSNNAGETPLDIIFARLSACNERYQLGLTEGVMVNTIQQAADLHNRSVGNMVSDDLAEFLDHTWSLLPEQHAALRRHALYTLDDYYQAIHSMVQITQNMQPANVYISFRGLPDAVEMASFHSRLEENLRISTIYLRARLFSVAVVSAMACLTGGGGPKSFFFGDLPSNNRTPEKLGESILAAMAAADKAALMAEPRGSLLDKQPSSRAAIEMDEVYDILCGDRMSDTGFDTRNAPLAAYLYRELGDTVICQELEKLTVPMTEQDARQLLRSLPDAVVRSVGEELAEFVISRKKRIEKIVDEFGGGATEASGITSSSKS